MTKEENAMTSSSLAWVVRSIMVAVAAVVAYLLVQDQVVLDPLVTVILGAISVALAALNPTTISDRLGS
jgi:tetrahydromethanopterin S-methyltransferase subunit E